MQAVQRAQCGIPPLRSLHAQPGQGDAVPQRGECRPWSSKSGRVLGYVGGEEGLHGFSSVNSQDVVVWPQRSRASLHS
eukprot:1065275-Prorocentrum_minimum.AAC.1